MGESTVLGAAFGGYLTATRLAMVDGRLIAVEVVRFYAGSSVMETAWPWRPN